MTAKAAPVRNSTGGFTKEDFDIDLERGAVTCPAGHHVPCDFGRGGEGKASFKGHCRHCPLKSQCTPVAPRAHDHRSILKRHCCAGPVPSRKAPSGKPVTNQPAHCRAQDLPFHPAALGRAQGPGARGQTRSPPTSSPELRALNDGAAKGPGQQKARASKRLGPAKGT